MIDLCQDENLPSIIGDYLVKSDINIEPDPNPTNYKSLLKLLTPVAAAGRGPYFARVPYLLGGFLNSIRCYYNWSTDDHSQTADTVVGQFLDSQLDPNIKDQVMSMARVLESIALKGSNALATALQGMSGP